MREYLLTLLVTATVTYLLTPLVRRVATKTGAIHAVRDRDVHLVPTPLMGGLAMYGGLAAGLWVAGQLTPLRTVFEGTGMASGLLLAGGLIVIVGIVDDRWGLNPISKLAGQVAAAAIIVWKGAELNWLPEPGRGTLILTSNQSIALTILVVVATVNAVNFIDGLDGLAAGVICIAAVSFFIYYYALTKAVHVSAEAGPALAAIVLAGACIGFLPHNFHPARIFMGDTGSMLLGLLLAYVPISSISSLDPSTLTNYGGGAVNRFPQILPLIPPAAIMLIPYANLILAIVRRTKAGQPWHAPDRGHLHDRLLDIGHSHRSTVLILYLWAALFSGTVVWLSIANTKVLVFLVTTLAAVLLLLLMSMPRLRWWDRSSRPSAMAGNAVPGAAAGKAVAGAAAGIAPASSAATGAAAVGAAAGPSAAAGSAEGRPAEGRPAEGRRRGTPPWGSAPAPPGVSARPR